MEFHMLKKIVLSSVVSLGLVSAAIAGGLEPQKKSAPAATPVVKAAPPVQAVKKAEKQTAAPFCGAVGATLSRVDADYKGPETSIDDKNYGFGLVCVTTPLFGFDSEAEVAYTKWIDEGGTYTQFGSPYTQDTKITSVEFTLKAKRPITNRLSLFVKGGFVRGKIKQVDTIPGLVMSTLKVTDTAPIFGVGADYQVTDNQIIRLDYSDMDFKRDGRKAAVDGVKLTLVHLFN
mgnify:CR=1 FL=1